MKKGDTGMSETMQKTYKYLIIGNSAAGIGAVEGIRGIDE